MFMLNETDLARTLSAINPTLVRLMDDAERFRRFGLSDKLETALCKMEDVQALAILKMVGCYYGWLGTVYLPASEYPGDSVSNPVPMNPATPCPPLLPTEPSVFSGSMSVTANCDDPPLPELISLDEMFQGDYFDRTSAFIVQGPVKGRANVDASRFGLVYVPTEGLSGNDNVQVGVKDIYGRVFYGTVSIYIDCSAPVPTDCSGFVSLSLTPTIIAVIGSEDGDGNRTNAVTATPNGGTAPYTYLWTVDAPVTIHGSNSNPVVFLKYDPLDFPVVTKKVYLTCTDANGCVRTANQFVGYISMPCVNLTLDVIGNTELEIDLGALCGLTSYHEGLILDQVLGLQTYRAPGHGTLEVLDNLNGIVKYVPATGYVGGDVFDYAFDLGNDLNGDMHITGLCTITLNVLMPEPICPPAQLTMQSSIQALADPEAIIPGTDLLLLTIEALNVTDVSQLTVVFKNAGDGTVLGTPDLNDWDFTANILYGGISIPDNQVVRIEVTADNGCEVVELLWFHEVIWNQAPIANDEEVFCWNTSNVLINLLEDDYDPDGDPITLIEIDGQPFDSGPNDTVVLSGGQGTVEWVDGMFVRYTPPAPLPLGTFTFSYTIQDEPANPLEQRTATANVTVETKLKYQGAVSIGIDSIVGAQGARTIVLEMTATGVNASRNTAWYVNTGAGYGAADAQTTETATFTEPATIISVRVEVTETAGNLNTYIGEIDLHT